MPNGAPHPAAGWERLVAMPWNQASRRKNGGTRDKSGTRAAVKREISDMDFDKELDARGLNCPLPILKSKKSLTEFLAHRHFILAYISCDYYRIMKVYFSFCLRKSFRFFSV